MLDEVRRLVSLYEMSRNDEMGLTAEETVEMIAEVVSPLGAAAPEWAEQAKAALQECYPTAPFSVQHKIHALLKEAA